MDHSKSEKGGKVKGGQGWEQSQRVIIEKERELGVIEVGNEDLTQLGHSLKALQAKRF